MIKRSFDEMLSLTKTQKDITIEKLTLNFKKIGRDREGLFFCVN